jgi:hypothetical protein
MDFGWPIFGKPLNLILRFKVNEFSFGLASNKLLYPISKGLYKNFDCGWKNLIFIVRPKKLTVIRFFNLKIYIKDESGS